MNRRELIDGKLNMSAINIRPCSPSDPDGKQLLDELSSQLFEITGNDGCHSFAEDDVHLPGSIFLIAFMDNEPVGCGGIRPISDEICEIKRMYARYSGRGIGARVLRGLEIFAIDYGYKKIWLETRKVNQHAVRFYLNQGYVVRENYGKYQECKEAICFEKQIN